MKRHPLRWLRDSWVPRFLWGKRMGHFPIKSCSFSREVFQVFRFPSLGIAYQKGSWSRDECSRKSDAQAITITILFSMKPGWIWDGGRTPHFFMDHGETLCGCSASIFLYKKIRIVIVCDLCTSYLFIMSILLACDVYLEIWTLLTELPESAQPTL